MLELRSRTVLIHRAINMPDDKHRYPYNGRVLGAFALVDELYRGRLTAVLAMGSLGIKLEVVELNDAWR
jgi:hypothetical protein